MFFIKKRIKLLHFLFVIFAALVLFLTIPYKLVLTPPMSQLAFVYSDTDSIDIKNQVSYTLGVTIGNTANFENDSENTSLIVNKVILLNWLNKCKKRCLYTNSEGINIDNNEVTVTCPKEDVPRKMIDADVFIRYLFVKQLFFGVKTEKISVKVKIIEQNSNNILISADWPKEDYIIDRDLFFE